MYAKTLDPGKESTYTKATIDALKKTFTGERYPVRNKVTILDQDRAAAQVVANHKH